MPTIFDYLTDCQHQSFYDRPCHQLDALILTELTYLSFDKLVSSSFQKESEQRLLEIAPSIPRELNMLTNKARLQLLDCLAQHKRFKNVKLIAFVNEVDHRLEKQFAAVVYRIALDTFVLIFRGTDDSIIGWKEDFHMTYMKEIPAQKRALAYLEAFFSHYPKSKLILAGHSKGGNLARFAASYLPERYHAQINAIYTFDAPGLQKHHTETPGYTKTSPKVKRYIPNGSIVGMMLEIPEEPIIVKSSAIGGIAQHNTFTWQVEKDNFVTVKNTSADSQQVDSTFKDWVEHVPDQELQAFFDLFFNSILEAGITSINDMATASTIKHIRQLFAQAQSLSTEQKELLNRLMQLLLETRYQAWKNR